MLRKTSLKLWPQLILPIDKRRGTAIAPLCNTCGANIYNRELVEGEPDHTPYAKVLVKCHGAEELHTFDMGTIHWTAEELKRYMQAHQWFLPNLHAESGFSAA